MFLAKIHSGGSKYSESEGETRMSVNPSIDHSLLSNYKSNHSQKQKRIRNNRQKSPLEQIEGLKWATPRIIDPNRNLRSISQNRDAFNQKYQGGLINKNSSDAQSQFLISQDKYKNSDDEQFNEGRNSYQKMSFGEVPIMLGRNNDHGLQNKAQSSQKDIQKSDDKESKIEEAFEKIELRKQQFNELASMNEEEIMSFFRSYAVHNSENTPIQQIIGSIHLKIEITKQFVYFGEVINRQHIGKGIILYSNGRVYEGEWQNDCKFGKGYELFPNGNEYEGYYVNGKSEGVGTYTWANKEVYQGQWLGGFKHGSGIWRGRKGDSYIGEWNRGKADGYGVHTWQNGDRYEGEFKGCLKHGNGNEKFSNGDSYSGMYVNGRPEGQGQYNWSNGSSYVGEFKNGLRHGKGIWRKDNMVDGQSEQYEGEYQNDKKCGKGVFIWKSGNQYCGNFFDDLRDGYGEMYWKDGTTYKGNWSKGIQSGEGEVSAPGQPIFKGIFKGSEFQGNTNSLQTQYKDQQIQKDSLDTLNENRSKRQQISNCRHQKFQNYPAQFQGKHQADKMLYVPQILQYSAWKGQSKANDSQPQYPLPPAISQIQDSIIYPQRQERNSNYLGNQISSREEEHLAILSDLTNVTHLNQENDLSCELESASKHLNNRFVGNNFNNQQFSIPNNISTISTISPLNRFKLSPIRLKTEQLSPKSSVSPYKPSIKIKTKSQNSNINIRDPSPANYQSSSFICKTSNSNKKISTPSQLAKLRSVTPSASMCNNNHNRSSHKKILPSLVSGQKSHSSQSPKHSNKDRNKKILLKKHEILVWNSLRPKLCIPNNAMNNLKDKKIVEKIREILHPPLWKPAGLHQVKTSPEKENKSRSGSR